MVKVVRLEFIDGHGEELENGFVEVIFLSFVFALSGFPQRKSIKSKALTYPPVKHNGLIIREAKPQINHSLGDSETHVGRGGLFGARLR